jgi:hypothetical protein
MEQAVTLALAGGRDRTDNSLDLAAGRVHRDRAHYRRRINRLRFKLPDNVFRNLGQHTTVQNVETLGRPPDDVAAFAARIDLRMDLPGTASDSIIRLEQEMPAA